MNPHELAKLIRPNLDQTTDNNESQIAKFYNNRSVLLTGASGFVGKFIIEKLLRACPELNKIYIIIRHKKNKSPQDRANDLLNSVVFDGVRHVLRHKIKALEGDIIKPLFGLNQADLDEVVANVSVVIHSAAVVGFEQPLKRAVESNLIGAHNVIQLARKLDNLASLVYVSTAYANCIRRQLDEHVYPVNIEPEAMIDMATNVDTDLLESIKGRLMGDHPNTYTYTKSLAEWLCYEYANRHQMPIVLCRPSVVTAAWREPIAGLVDNINAANGIHYHIVRGVLRTAHCEPLYNLDHIPVDVVTNCILAAAWFGCLYHGHRLSRTAADLDGQVADPNTTMTIKKYAKKLQEFQENVSALAESKGMPTSIANLPVFHVSSGADRPMSLGTMIDYVISYSLQYPSMKLFRCPSFEASPIPIKVYLHKLLAHKLAAKCMDIYSMIVGGYKANYWTRTTRNADHFMDVISYFTLRNWDFNPENRHRLITEFMSAEDRRLFNCDISSIDWREYCRTYALGLRRFVLKEPEENVKEARRRLRMIYWRNSVLQVALAAAACYLAAILVL